MSKRLAHRVAWVTGSSRGIGRAVAAQLAGLDLGQSIEPGQTVAISAGSRGIANIAEIIKAACDILLA